MSLLVGKQLARLHSITYEKGVQLFSDEWILTLLCILFLQGVDPAHGPSGQVFHPSKSLLHQDPCCQIGAETCSAIEHGFPILIELGGMIPQAIQGNVDSLRDHSLLDTFPP